MLFAAVWIFLYTAAESHQVRFFRTFECINGQCQRTQRPVSILDVERLKIHGQHTTLAACKLICGGNGALWPLPTGPFSIGNNYLLTHPDKITFDLTRIPPGVDSLINEVINIFRTNVESSCGDNCDAVDSSVIVHVNVESGNLELGWNTYENYILRIITEDEEVHVHINATSVYGARHALETLSQLIAPIIKSSDKRGLVIIDEANIDDKPIFKHRGVMIDTGRNYLPVSAILRTIDGLAATKMNVLHWHATDSQSFPLQIKSRPLMSWYGAYSPKMIYTPEDMGRIRNYAKYRGVRVILEMDSPAHAATGWEWGETQGLGKLAVCVEQQPWRNFCIQPPCGQLNPVNPHVFEVLRDVYKDFFSILGNDTVLHIGGDEVWLPCWNSTQEIVDAMQARGLGRTTEDFLKLWGEFHNEQLELISKLKERSDSVIVWSSGLTEPNVIEQYLDKNRFIIQTWLPAASTVPEELLKRGYKLIISTKDAWYLDHGFWGITKYHSWRDVYENRIPRKEAVLGGEVCMWGEYVNQGGLDARIWPRAAAAGERLWTDSTTLKTIDVEPRFQAHRDRLENRNVKVDAISPAWCAQHATKCD
ncbi:chitooligosaccharidolytic beta-N-acetylglucosaminidase isoform X2 [Fopius arisanus]|nr:PREDICTED: chitooligosaccharidolytic beta-N-acetylglucosaminidase isoform X2 [Fopius arisanus]